MKNMTKAELKNIVYEGLRSEYGFAPKKSEIVLLEANGEGTYILFSVNGHEYSFNSRICHSLGNTIWVGSGTITKNS